MPQGDKRGTGWEFYDDTYDGHWDGELRRGLGQLTDGKVGPENFRMGYYGSGKSKLILLNHSPRLKMKLVSTYTSHLTY